MQQHCACAFHWGCICYKAQKGGFFTRRILCGKEHEVGVGVDGLLQLWHKQLPVVVQEPVKHRHIDVECSCGAIIVATAVDCATTAVVAPAHSLVAPADSLCIGPDLESNTLRLLRMRHAQKHLPRYTSACMDVFRCVQH